MHTDWSVECGAEDPWVVIPWQSEDNTVHYIDLRAEPGRLLEIPEAALYGPYARALLRWNGPDSPLHTAKCDAWQYSASLFDANDLPGFAYAQGGYIDLLPARPKVFSSFAACEKRLRAFSRAAELLPHGDCRCEWILRRARIVRTPQPASHGEDMAPDLAPWLDGFAVTLYAWGYGDTAESAQIVWSGAVDALIEPVLFAAGS